VPAVYRARQTAKRLESTCGCCDDRNVAPNRHSSPRYRQYGRDADDVFMLNASTHHGWRLERRLGHAPEAATEDDEKLLEAAGKLHPFVLAELSSCAGNPLKPATECRATSFW
jgi:hypothetical protein